MTLNRLGRENSSDHSERPSLYDLQHLSGGGDVPSSTPLSVPPRAGQPAQWWGREGVGGGLGGGGLQVGALGL